MRVYWSWLVYLLAFAILAPRAQAGPALLLDAQSSRVFYAEEPDHPWHPASTTKLMTAYLAFEALRDGRLKLNDAVLQSERSIKEPPSKIGLAVGLGMSVELALQSLIIKSANDVAVMLAEKIGGSVENFVAMMNEKARQLGMTETQYVNPNGLHNPGQITTARDLAILTLALMRDFPEQKARFSRYYMNIGNRRLHSYNSLLKSYPGADGMKTGFVCASGYNIVASATRNGHRLIAVVLGADSMQDRQKRASELLTYGFEYYDWKLLLAEVGDTPPLAKLPRGPFKSAPPADMRSVVCRPHVASVGKRGLKKRKASRKRSRRLKRRR